MRERAAMKTGIYCKECGFDLQGSLSGGKDVREGAGRCPECGRIFIPDAPGTYRTRPLDAWKQTAGRWARRAALLLLVLLPFVVGTWVWFYQGWKQEQAALAALGATHGRAAVPPEWVSWPGVRTRYVGFVFERVYWVELPPSATDASLAHLRRLPRLCYVDLRGTKVTDTGLVQLRDLPDLDTLDLGRTSITDAGLAHLAGLPHLRVLGLEATAVTDAGVVHLTTLPALGNLNMGGTRITDAGVAQLRAAKPACFIWGP